MTEDKSAPVMKVEASGGSHIHHVLQQNINLARLPTSAPFQAPPVPNHFVSRPELAEDLKTALLGETDAADGTLKVSAIHGSPGIGKSTLAAALAHDLEVRDQFPGGILWVPLGQEPNLLPLLIGWLQAQGYYEPYSTVKSAADKLSSLFQGSDAPLRDKAALLIIDDAWDAADAKHFMVGHPCRVLMTTRRVDVAEEVGAEVFDLDVMTPEQALALLSLRLGRSLDKAEEEKALLVANEVGYLPMALEQVAVRIARGVDWDSLWKGLTDEVTRLNTLEDPRHRRKGQTRLEASFNLSLDALRADDESAWRAFVWLGVLPNDAAISAPMAATLWEVNEKEANDLLELLWNDALLLPGLPVKVGSSTFKGYRIQSLVQGWARRLITTDQPRGLNLKLPEAHQAFLEHYRRRLKDQSPDRSSWHTLPDDGYIHTHLTWHLQKAGRANEIHALLSEETAAGRNGWFETRDRLGQASGYLDDVSKAWQLAEESSAQQIELNEPALDAGLETRYALITTSLRSLARNIPPNLISRLEETKKWAPEQRLSYARGISDPGKRGSALVALAPQLPDRLLNRLIDDIWSLNNDFLELEALVSLSPILTERLPAQAKAIGDAFFQLLQSQQNEFLRVNLLRCSIHYISEARRNELLDGIFGPRQSARAELWATEFLKYSLDFVLSPFGFRFIYNSLYIQQWNLERYARTEDWIPRSLSEDLTRMSLQQVRQWFLEAPEKELLYHRGNRRFAVLSVIGSFAPVFLNLISPRMSDEQFQQWFRNPSTVDPPLMKTMIDSAFVQNLSWFAPYLPQSLLQEALKRAETITDDHVRLEALAILLLCLPKSIKDEAVEKAVELARSVVNPHDWVGAQTRIAAYLSEELLSETLSLAERLEKEQEEENDSSRKMNWLRLESRGLGGATVSTNRTRFFPNKDGSGSERVQEAEEPRTLAFTNAPKLSEVIEQLSQYLQGSLVDQALKCTRTIKNDVERVEAVSALLFRLSGPAKSTALKEAIAMGRAIENRTDRISALISLAPHMSEPELQDTLMMVTGIENGEGRMSYLEELVPHVPETMLQSALEAARGIGDKYWQDEVLEVSVPALLDSDQQHEALEAAKAIEDRVLRAETLTLLGYNLPDQLKDAVLDEALKAAREIEAGVYRRRKHAPVETRSAILAEVAGHFSEPMKGEVLGEALEVELGFEHPEARALFQIGMNLARSGHPEEAFEIIRRTHWSLLDEAIAWIIKYLPDPQRQDTLAIARAVEHPATRAAALGRLAPYLKEPLALEALETAQLIDDHRQWIQTLITFVSDLPEPEKGKRLSEGLEKAKKIHDDRGRAKCLMILSPYLTESQLHEALQMAEAIIDRQWQSVAKAEVARRLAELGNLPKAMAIVREIDADYKVYPLGRIAPYLSGQSALLREALAMVVAIKPGDYSSRTDEMWDASGAESTASVVCQPRAIVLREIAPHLTSEFRRDLYGIWNDILHQLAVDKLTLTADELVTNNRENLLKNLGVLSPVLMNLGGAKALAEVTRAIQDVGRWWP